MAVNSGNSISIFLKYARFRYILFRIFLRIKMGKMKRDEYIQKNRTSEIDFLPERPYVMECGAKAIPRKGTRDFLMLFISREQNIIPYLTMKENETFVDVGANVGAYTLMIAKHYSDNGVKVIAIEAHPENYDALCRNIRCNKNFPDIITPVNRVVSDHKSAVNIFDRSHDGTRIDSELYSISNDEFLSKNNVIHPGGKSLQLESDTLDNILAEKVDVMKIDIEGAEVLALKGATNTLKHLRKIIIEIHGDNLEAVRRILESHNFRIETSGINQHLIGSK